MGKPYLVIESLRFHWDTHHIYHRKVKDFMETQPKTMRKGNNHVWLNCNVRARSIAPRRAHTFSLESSRFIRENVTFSVGNLRFHCRFPWDSFIFHYEKNYLAMKHSSTWLWKTLPFHWKVSGFVDQNMTCSIINSDFIHKHKQKRKTVTKGTIHVSLNCRAQSIEPIRNHTFPLFSLRFHWKANYILHREISDFIT